MNRHIDNIRQLEAIAGESLIAGFVTCAALLVVAWVGAIMAWGV